MKQQHQFKDKYFKEMMQRHFKDYMLFRDTKMLEHWECVPIFGPRIKQRAKEAWEDGFKKGIEEGREERRKEGMTFLQENILDILNLRFGVANGRIARAVHAIDALKRLRAVFQRAIKADSLEAVKKMLAAQKRPAKKRARAGAK